MERSDLYTHVKSFQGGIVEDMKSYVDPSIDDYAKDGGEELFTKMHCVRITNP